MSIESLGPCFSHGMGDHDQILQHSPNRTVYHQLGLSNTNFRLADELVAIVATAVVEAVVHAGSLVQSMKARAVIKSTAHNLATSLPATTMGRSRSRSPQAKRGNIYWIVLLLVILLQYLSYPFTNWAVNHNFRPPLALPRVIYCTTPIIAQSKFQLIVSRSFVRDDVTLDFCGAHEAMPDFLTCQTHFVKFQTICNKFWVDQQPYWHGAVRRCTRPDSTITLHHSN